MKKIGYLVFALFFHLFRVRRVNENKVFFVATHDASQEGNMGVVKEAIMEKNRNKRCIMMTKRDGISHPFHFFVTLSYHMATSKYIFLDNIFLPMAFLHFSKSAQVVQLWHGTGTVKRFGQSVNQGELKVLEEKANRQLTHLIVNSEYTKDQYQEAFGVDSSIIYPIGLPRTDLLFSFAELEKRKNSFFTQYANLVGKRILLYAPTFRDDEVLIPKVNLDFRKLSFQLREDEVLLLRLHPHVAANFKMEDNPQIMNFSEYDDITTLLTVSDVLITDYSSVIFEYCVLEKPMIFYAYDLDEFETTGRAFYEPYTEYVPGVVVYDQDELFEAVSQCEVYSKEATLFRDQSYKYVDGKSTMRLLDLLGI